MRCGEVGHLTSECKVPQEKSSSFVVCRQCGEIGHISSECKTAKVAMPNVCPLCGKIGHTLAECPSDMPGKKEEEKKETKAAPVKKAMTSEDLKDTEQFPSL